MRKLCIFIVLLTENMCICRSRERQHMRKSLYYPYKTTHKSIYLKYRRLDYDYITEPTTSIYLPNFDKTISTNESPKISGTATSSISSLLDLNSSDITSVISISDPRTSRVVDETTNNAIPDINPNVTATILIIDNTTTEVLSESERLREETSTLISDTSSLISPPSFEAYSPGSIQTPSSSILIHTTTQNPIAKEIKELSHKDGYFTASSIVLLKTLASMDGNYVKCLLASLNLQIQRLETEENFSIFGGKPAEIIMSSIQALALEPTDVMKDQLQFVIYGIENRQSFLAEDTNTLLDVIDTVYLERDGEDIAEVIEEIKTSNCSRSTVIVEHLLRVFLLFPFQRIEDTARQHVISAGIKYIVDYRFKNMNLHI